MKHEKTVKLVLAALFAALCCVATMLIHIPIPATNGYINLGAGLILGALAGELIMVLGYFAYESTLLGYGLAAAASIPGNALQGAGGFIVGVLACKALRALPQVRRLCD